MKTLLRWTAPIVLAVALPACATAPSSSNQPLVQQLLVDKSRVVVDTFAADPEMTWFRAYLKDAKGVMVIPDLFKGAYFLGGSGGRGVLLVKDSGTDNWFGPAFYTMGSVSFGLQIGGQESEAIILVMTQKGIESLQKTSLKLGVGGSAAVGPIGVGGQGATAPSLHVDYITYMRSMGAFIGISLDGAVINENYEWNKTYYGKPVRPTDILIDRNAVNPKAAELRSAISSASKTP